MLGRMGFDFFYWKSACLKKACGCRGLYDRLPFV